MKEWWANFINCHPWPPESFVEKVYVSSVLDDIQKRPMIIPGSYELLEEGA
jgi:hypothetical protein